MSNKNQHQERPITLIRNGVTLLLMLAGLGIWLIPLHISEDSFWHFILEIKAPFGEFVTLIMALHFLHDNLLKKWERQEYLSDLNKIVSKLKIENKFAKKIDTLEVVLVKLPIQKLLLSVLDALLSLFRKENFGRLPPFSKILFEDEIAKKIGSLNDYLLKAGNGTLKITHHDSVDATFLCMRNAKSEVFAISFPDIKFWRGREGQEYIEKHKDAMASSPSVRIRRYFIIQDNEEDRKIFSDNNVKDEFIDVLKTQFANKIELYVLHEKEVRLEDLEYEHIPDVSLYDGVIASEWTQRARGKVSETVISFKGEFFNRATKTYEALKTSHSKTTQISSEADILKRVDELKMFAYQN